MSEQIKREKTPDAQEDILHRKARQRSGYQPAKSADEGQKSDGSIGSDFHKASEFVPLALELSQPGYETVRAEAFARLQQHYGNRFVQTVVEGVSSAAEAVQSGNNPEPRQKEPPLAAPPPPPQVEEVETVISPGSTPETTAHTTAESPSAEARIGEEAVQPGGRPNVVEPGGGNTCTPSTRRATLSWDVVSDGLRWRPSVQSLTLTGTIEINPWSNRPNDMVVPNTANPVDGGNISNDPASDNYWEKAAQDMEDYDTAGGGAGPNWHSTEASRAHEWAHWHQDYIANSVSSANGGNWPAANREIEALSVSKLPFRWTAEQGRAALEPLVNQKVEVWRSKTIDRWNAIDDDEPGKHGAGYVAGARVLQNLISRVRTYGFLLQLRSAVRRIVGALSS